MDDPRWILGPLDEPAVRRLAEELSGSELHAVLMHVVRAHARRRTPKDLLAQYRDDAFCAPGPVDLRTSVEVDGHLLAAAEGFEAVDLSPVAPLGACSVVAPTDQHRVLSALRSLEVVSDPTNVLALECARRLRARPAEGVHLATSQRVVRAQPVPKLPGYARHFRLFALASGGREAAEHAFTVGAVARHVGAVHAALDRLEGHGYAFGARRVEVLATPARRALGDRVAGALGGAVERGGLEHPYYSGGLRYRVWVTEPAGASVPLVDGGAFDWLATLAADRRMVYVATGLGAGLVPLRFRAAP